MTTRGNHLKGCSDALVAAGQLALWKPRLIMVAAIVEGALRAAKAIEANDSHLASLPELIDRETGVREILEILESIIAQAGDLIESRSPELVAAARASLKRYSDDTAGQAE